MRFWATGAAMILGLIAGCSGPPEDPIAQVKDNGLRVLEQGRPAPPAELPHYILAGGGLRGLELFPRSRLESTGTMMRLFSAAYANSPTPTGAFERDGVHYDSRPQFAFRDGNRIVLIVNHASPAEEQIHADAGGSSVFYFNADGSGPTRSFPQALTGTTWGAEANTYLVILNGTPAAISEAGGTFQGYSCSNRTITFFGAQGISTLPAFPTLYENSGASGGTEVSLVGAAVSADGAGLDLRYEGHETSPEGTLRPVALSRSLRFDGGGAEWIREWPYSC